MDHPCTRDRDIKPSGELSFAIEDGVVNDRLFQIVTKNKKLAALLIDLGVSRAIMGQLVTKVIISNALDLNSVVVLFRSDLDLEGKVNFHQSISLFTVLGHCSVCCVSHLLRWQF